MLSRFSEVLQTAADVLAPPATRLEDFEYHWRLILHFYNSDQNKKVAIEETKIPFHLHQMLQLLIDEETESPNTIGACLEKILEKDGHHILDCLTLVASVDIPSGTRAAVLAWCTCLLRRLKTTFLDQATIYKPIQRLLIQCNEETASPTEKEEVELLLTICGMVRKQPGLANVFTTPFLDDKTKLTQIPNELLNILPIKAKVYTPTRNPLFDAVPNLNTVPLMTPEVGSVVDSNDDVTSCKSQNTIFDETDKFLLIDLLLSYLESADNHIVLRACEGVMILTSLPDDDIANMVTSCSPVCEVLIEKLVKKYKAIPLELDPCDVDQLNISWGYVAQDYGDRYPCKFPGYRELSSFLSWLDYCDTLVKECHPIMANHLARTFRQNFLEGGIEMAFGDVTHTILVTAVLTKCLKVIDSAEFISEISNWLVGDGDLPDWPLLHTMINNCLSENPELSVETLRFFEAILEKPTEHSLHRLVLCHFTNRGYLSRSIETQCNDEDERDRLNDVSLQRERDGNREAMAQLMHEGHISEQIAELIPHTQNNATSIHKVINSFLLLLPKAILSDPLGSDYEQYIQDAQKQFQAWLDVTSTFQWSQEIVWTDTTSNSTHSYDSRPEVDLHMDRARSLKNFRKRSLKEISIKRSDTESSKYDETIICCPIDDNSVVIGKCGKPAALCPFKQHLVHRNKHIANKKPNDLEQTFDEGPFLRMVFKILEAMPDSPYQINLQLTSIISKLAMLPHQNLHEYLLNPMLPVAKNTKTLFKVLQGVAKRLTAEIPRYKNYKKIIEFTRAQLMSEDPAYDESVDHNHLFEGLIVIEEFCKELAAISLVKYQNGMQFIEV